MAIIKVCRVQTRAKPNRCGQVIEAKGRHIWKVEFIEDGKPCMQTLTSRQLTERPSSSELPQQHKNVVDSTNRKNRHDHEIEAKLVDACTGELQVRLSLSSQDENVVDSTNPGDTQI